MSQTRCVTCRRRSSSGCDGGNTGRSKGVRCECHPSRVLMPRAPYCCIHLEVPDELVPIEDACRRCVLRCPAFPARGPSPVSHPGCVSEWGHHRHRHCHPDCRWPREASDLYDGLRDRVGCVLPAEFAVDVRTRRRSLGSRITHAGRFACWISSSTISGMV